MKEPYRYKPSELVSQALCIPKTKQEQCEGCTRYRPDRLGIEGVVVDATVLKWFDGLCPMRSV
jgi:hypothetical protein